MHCTTLALRSITHYHFPVFHYYLAILIQSLSWPQPEHPAAPLMMLSLQAYTQSVLVLELTGMGKNSVNFLCFHLISV